MRTIIIISVLAIFLSSCSSFDLSNSGSSSIGGTTNIPRNTVGNDFKPSITLGNSTYTGSASIIITEIEDGVATINFKATLPANKPILAGIKTKYLDSSGKLDCVGTFKMTDKGILDYNNIDHEPFVLVKYDAKVGDKYTLEKSNGETITRTVVRKSTDDDWLWNGMNIKTIDVEQDSRIPGVDKLVYYSNHSFGLVAVRVYLEDGTDSQLNLYPTTN